MTSELCTHGSDPVRCAACLDAAVERAKAIGRQKAAERAVARREYSSRCSACGKPFTEMGTTRRRYCNKACRRAARGGKRSRRALGVKRPVAA